MAKRIQKQRTSVHALAWGGFLSATLAIASTDDTSVLLHAARLYVWPDLLLQYLGAERDTPSARACTFFVETGRGRHALLERFCERLEGYGVSESARFPSCGVLGFEGDRLVAKLYRRGQGTVGVRERGVGDDALLFGALAERLPSWKGARLMVEGFPFPFEVLPVDEAARRYEAACGDKVQGQGGPLWPLEACLFFWDGGIAR